MALPDFDEGLALGALFSALGCFVLGGFIIFAIEAHNPLERVRTVMEIMGEMRANETLERREHCCIERCDAAEKVEKL